MDVLSGIASKSPWLVIAVSAFVCGSVFAARVDLMRVRAKACVNQMLPAGQKVRTPLAKQILDEYERHFADRTTRTRMRRSGALSGAFFAVMMLSVAAAGAAPAISIVAALGFLAFAAATLNGFFF